MLPLFTWDVYYTDTNTSAQVECQLPHKLVRGVFDYRYSPLETTSSLLNFEYK